MFTTEIRKIPSDVRVADAEFEVLFTGLSFDRSPITRSFTISLGATATTERYQINKNQQLNESISSHNGTQNIVNYTIIARKSSPVDSLPLKFTVIFENNACKVFRVIGGLEYIKLEHAVTLYGRCFRFTNVSSADLLRLSPETAHRYTTEATEAFKVGIFMLALGCTGARKLGSRVGAFANWVRETVEKTDVSGEIAESTSDPVVKESENGGTDILDGTDVTRPIVEGMNALDVQEANLQNLEEIRVEPESED